MIIRITIISVILAFLFTREYGNLVCGGQENWICNFSKGLIEI